MELLQSCAKPTICLYIGGLVQDCSISSELVLYLAIDKFLEDNVLISICYISISMA